MINSIGERIRELRNFHGETQANLADAVNVSRVVVAKWENGQPLKAEDIIAIAKHYDITTDSLLLGSTDEKATKLSYKTGISGTASSVLVNDEQISRCVDTLLTSSPGIDFLLAVWEYIRNKGIVDKYDLETRFTLIGDYDLKGWIRYELMRKLSAYLDDLTEDVKNSNGGGNTDA